jgi:hypothetical protein
MPPKSKNKKKPSKQQPPADEPPKDEDRDWTNHPARAILYDALWSGDIPLDWNRKPINIYNKFKDSKEFEGMPYDTTFQRRLINLRHIVQKQRTRVYDDKIAYDIFRNNFPVRQTNDVGVLRWHGSLAQHYLKADMKAGLHIGKKPAEFQKTRAEFQQFSSDTFRKHIDQERKLWKLEHYLEVKAEKDAAKAEKKAKKNAKKRRQAKAEKKSEEKKMTDEEEDAEEQAEENEDIDPDRVL